MFPRSFVLVLSPGTDLVALQAANQPWRSRALRAADDESVPSQDERPNTGAVNNDFSPTIQILSGNSFRGTRLGFMCLVHVPLA